MRHLSKETIEGSEVPIPTLRRSRVLNRPEQGVIDSGDGQTRVGVLRSVRVSSDPGESRVEKEPGRYQPGNKEDFNRLYKATYPRIFATLFMILKDRSAAEDATQEAFLRAFRGWHRWKQDAPAEAWMHRIALNVAFSHRRREQLHDIGQLLIRLGRPRDPDPTEGVNAELRQAIRSLPPKQAASLVLRHLHGYSNREIAIALGIPERTVASRLAAAKVWLRARLGEQRSRGLGRHSPNQVLSDDEH